MSSWTTEDPIRTTAGLEAPYLALEAPDADPASDTIVYLREIARIPLLSRREQAALAAALREATEEFRTRVLALPGAARLAVERWRALREAGRVTGTLSAGYRDGSGHDYTPDVDAALARAERLLVRGAKASAKLRDALESANLSTDVIQQLFEGLRDRSRSRAVRAAGDAFSRLLDLKNRFVQHNLRLVVSVAKEYRNMGVEFVDLIQEANIGLVRAVEKFDERRGFAFSTYAVWWLRQACIRAVQHHSRAVRLPATAYELILRYRRERSRLERELGRDPKLAELARALELDVGTMEKVVTWSRRETSTETPIPESDSLRLEDRLSDEGLESPITGIDRDQIRRELPALLDVLTDRERSIVEDYYGLSDGEGATLEQIGNEFGLSRERVRQIKVEALGKLRGRATTRGLEASLMPADRPAELGS